MRKEEGQGESEEVGVQDGASAQGGIHRVMKKRVRAPIRVMRLVLSLFFIEKACVLMSAGKGRTVLLSGRRVREAEASQFSRKRRGDRGEGRG
jgi:hypothetical protein